TMESKKYLPKIFSTTGFTAPSVLSIHSSMRKSRTRVRITGNVWATKAACRSPQCRPTRALKILLIPPQEKPLPAEDFAFPPWENDFPENLGELTGPTRLE